MPGGGVYYVGRSCLLYVDIDHIATLRKVRGGNKPDFVEGAILCEKSGCDGITVHLREDRYRDVIEIKNVIRRKLNLQMGFSNDIIDLTKKIKPNLITIISKKSGKITIEGGLDVRKNMSKIKDTVNLFHDQNTLVSLCIEVDIETIDLSKKCAVNKIEINKGIDRNTIMQTIL